MGKIKAKCLVCGATFYLDINGDWHCPVCGAYDGNGHIEWLDGTEVNNEDQLHQRRICKDA